MDNERRSTLDRRAFMTTTSGLGLTVIAGCLGDEQAEENEQAEDAQEAIEAAVDYLDNAIDTLDEEGEKFGDIEGTVTVKDQNIRSLVNQAESHLDRAEEVATDEQLEIIDTLQDLCSYLRLMADALYHYAEAVNAEESAFTYLRSDRYDDALDSFDEVKEEISKTEEALNEARRIESYIAQNLDDQDQLDADVALETWSEFDEDAHAFEIYIDGMRTWVRAQIYMEEGVDHLEDDDFSAAEESFTKAMYRFSEAHSIFSDNEDDVPSDMRPLFIEEGCVTGHLRDTADSLRAAVEAYENNNYNRAEEKMEEAEESLDKSEACRT